MDSEVPEGKPMSGSRCRRVGRKIRGRLSGR